MILRSGKYAGESLELVRIKDPGYISWCKENRPEMLKEKKIPAPKEITVPGVRKEVPEESLEPKSSLQPNLDFLSQIKEKQF
jgi:hypothetical protein